MPQVPLCCKIFTELNTQKFWTTLQYINNYKKNVRHGNNSRL